MLKEANRDLNWRNILGKATLDKHQKDVEIILRLFSLVGNVENYEKPMKEYLNRTMKKYGDGKSKKAEKFFALFPRVVDFVAQNLGPKPFHLRGPLNSSALDAVLVVLMESFATVKKEELAGRYNKLRANNNFLSLTQVSTTDTNVLTSRVKLAREILLG